MITFTVEVVLKGRDYAVTDRVTVPHGDPASWTDTAVRDVLVEVLRAIDRAQNPQAAPDRPVVLQGFSWIVEPVDDQVMIAVEIPLGAAVAGPFETTQASLDAAITRVLRDERERSGRSMTIH
jgi:hypothetical protein